MKNNVFNEKLKAVNFEQNGKFLFSNGFEIENLSSKGNLQVFGIGKFKVLFFKGKVQMESFEGEELEIKGEIFGKNILSEKVKIFGRVNLEKIEGKIINIKGGESRINFVQGDSITLEGCSSESKKENLDKLSGLLKKDFLSKINEYVNVDKIKDKMSTNDSYIYVDRILGRDIKLENVIANYVEGENIKIGKGCHINDIKNISRDAITEV